MDSQIIFVRTHKGEAELHSADSLLAGDIKRALLMVDGVATIADIEKRTAPSLRATLPTLMTELQSKGFIEDKNHFARVPKLVIPAKAKPSGEIHAQPTGEIAAQPVNEFDFTAAYRTPSAAVLATEAEREAALANKLKARQDAVRHLQAEKDAAHAHEELDQAKMQALAEAQARADSERRARDLAELARLKDEAIAKARAELAAVKAAAQAEAEARAAAELKAQQAAELRAQQEAEIAKLKAKQIMLAKAQAEEKAAFAAAIQQKERQAAELAAFKLEQEKMRLMTERQSTPNAQRDATAADLAKTVMIRAEAHPVVASELIDKADPNLRTTTVTVLFFDMVAYTKQPVQKQTEMKKLFNQLVTSCVQSVSNDRNEYIILDTGDGAAIGFTHHPEEALEVAIKFRDEVITNAKYADIKVRMGIHLGPINIVDDMNGKPNMVGNGINDAQRVMDFAGENQVFISRSYYDFISRLSDEFAEQFYYRGGQRDKHGHEHQVYALNSRMQRNQPAVDHAAATIKIELSPFTFTDPIALTAPKSDDLTSMLHSLENLDESPVLMNQEPDDPPIVLSDMTMTDIEPVSPPPAAPAKPLVSPEPAETERALAAKELSELEAMLAKKKALLAEIEAQKKLEEQSIEAKKLADMQAKAWSQAERRAIETAKSNAERAVHQAASSSASRVIKSQKIEVAPSKPFPWKGIFVSLFSFAVIAFGAALYVLPMVMPMDEYERKTELYLAERLQQPVHIGKMQARLFPSPQVSFDDLFVGAANQVRVQHVTVNIAVLSLLKAQKVISDIELVGLKVSGDGLTSMKRWLESVAGDATFPIQKISFTQGLLETEAFQLGEIEGQFVFNATGQFGLADLRAGSGKFGVTITRMGTQYQFSSIVRNAALPFLSRWVFNEMHATGTLSENELAISELDGSIADGYLKGNVNINWRTGWMVRGRLEASSLDFKTFSRHLVGDVDGTLNFKMQHGKFIGLVDTAILSGNFVAKKGVIQGVDIQEILRTRGREKPVGGRTNFDQLEGLISYSGNRYDFTQLRLKKGTLSADGQVSLEHIKSTVTTQAIENGRTVDRHKTVEFDKLLGRLDAKLEIQGEKPREIIEIEGTKEQFTPKVL